MNKYYCQFTNGHIATIEAESDERALVLAKRVAQRYPSKVDLAFMRPIYTIHVNSDVSSREVRASAN